MSHTVMTILGLPSSRYECVRRSKMYGSRIDMYESRGLYVKAYGCSVTRSSISIPFAIFVVISSMFHFVPDRHIYQGKKT